MSKSNDKTLLRIAEALERISPPKCSFGDLNEANTFLWKPTPDRLISINQESNITFDLLVGIEGAKDQVLKNTIHFAKGFVANNVLLWGARGTGKSSLVKSVHKMVAARHPHTQHDL